MRDNQAWTVDSTNPMWTSGAHCHRKAPILYLRALKNKRKKVDTRTLTNFKKQRKQAQEIIRSLYHISGTQCVLELFCEMLIMLIRQGEVRKWLNSESFICGVFRFCYGAGGVWVKCFFLLLLLLLLLFSFLICKIDFEFDLHQTNCHSPRISWNKRFINSAKIDI